MNSMMVNLQKKLHSNVSKYLVTEAERWLADIWKE